MQIVLIVLVVLAVIAFVIIRMVLARKRRDALAAWAGSHSWSFAERDDSFADRFRGGPFGEGKSRKARNVITGTLDGRPIVAFDYSYVTESTDSKGNTHRTTHEFTVTAVGLPAAVPDLTVSRENILTSLVRMVGFHDIEFENEEFNKKFKIKGQDRKFAYDVVNPRMMQWLLDTPGPAWCIERADLLCWQQGSASPEEHQSNLSYLAAIRAQIPGFVWDRPSAT